MTTNSADANVFAARGAQLKMKIAGAMSLIIVALWATAAPALANNLDSRSSANRTGAMIHKVRAADLGPESCRYVMPIILGIGF